MILVDTSLIVEYLRGRETAVTELQAWSSDGFAISTVVLAELYEGIARSRDPGATERSLLDFLRHADILPVDESVAREFGRLRFQLRSQGLVIGDLDILIAATALVHEATLLTRDNHFRRIPGVDAVFL